MAPPGIPTVRISTPDKMHSSLAVVFSVAIAFAGLASQRVEAGMLMQCLSDNGSSLSDFLRLLSTGDADHNVKCATKCAMVNLNTIDDDGGCLIEGLKAFHSEPLHDKISVCCDGASSIPDPCERVYSYQMCMRKADMDQLKKSWDMLTRA